MGDIPFKVYYQMQVYMMLCTVIICTCLCCVLACTCIILTSEVCKYMYIHVVCVFINDSLFYPPSLFSLSHYTLHYTCIRDLVLNNSVPLPVKKSKMSPPAPGMCVLFWLLFYLNFMCFTIFFFSSFSSLFIYLS